VVLWCLRKALGNNPDRGDEPAAAVPLARLPTSAEPTALATLHVHDNVLLVAADAAGQLTRIRMATPQASGLGVEDLEVRAYKPRFVSCTLHE
jgi:hypothetical protein